MANIPDTTPTTLVVLTPEQLSELVRDAVHDALAEHEPAEPPPELVDRRGLAHALSVSLSSVDRLIRDGAPMVRVGDSPRFRVQDVIRWLQARTGAPLTAIGGGKR